LFAVWLGAFAHAQSLSVTPDHADGVYQVGDTVRWRVRGSEPTARYSIKKGALTLVREGEAALADGVATIEAKIDRPGTLLLEVKSTDARALGGAVAAIDKIEPAARPPEDFEAFWQAKIEPLHSIPPNEKLEMAESGKTGIDYWKITLDNIRKSRIHGQIARPTGNGKLPALLIVQWAGVYPLEKHWAIDRAAEGWLVLNIQAHDLPIDEPPAFYKSQIEGPLKDYWSIGNDDRETSYFLRMILSCYRAAEYLSQRPDWDGKMLVVMGASQGGMQALVTAALHPKITAALAGVPAGCDMRGPEVGRLDGWPQWYGRTEGKDPAKVRRASDYFDVVNFAPRIKCPVLIGAGLADDVCPLEGIVAAFNQIRTPKELIILPTASHNNENDSHDPYNHRCYKVWLPILQQGKLPPVKQ
jgi:cephalosporin-C deacetylase-like acetyl esterase